MSLYGIRIIFKSLNPGIEINHISKLSEMKNGTVFKQELSD